MTDWEKSIKTLEEKKKKALEGGGAEAVEKVHGQGKLTARERLDILLDPGSFMELNMMAETQCTAFGMDKKKFLGDGVVTGQGRIEGRPVCVFAQDATVLGGSIGVEHGIKMANTVNQAIKLGVPLIQLHDSAGARIQEAVFTGGGIGRIFLPNTRASGLIPSISAIMGTCVGISVYSPAITDFIFMVEGTSRMFITGPPAIKAVTGEEVTKDDLGGAEVHSTMTGAADFAMGSDEECLNEIRRLLSYLPQNNEDNPPVVETGDPPDRKTDDLVDIVPADVKKPYDMHEVIESIVDQDSFMETKARFAPNLITGFGRLNGMTAGIIANQPMQMAGALTVNASDKSARFIRFCDCFNIPLVFLVDIPGYLPGKDQEHTGIIHHGAKVVYAFCEATVPKISLYMRKAFGGGILAMGGYKDLGADLVMAWPIARVAAMGGEGAVEVLYRKEIKKAKDPEAFRKEKLKEYEETYGHPYRAASVQRVDIVIHPSDTRSALINAVEYLRTKKTPEGGHKKKHGNMPL
jgi:acetyl-CoA carboxylase carboxyltransferase component